MLVTSTFRITWLHYTYGCLSIRAAYVCKVYVQNHWAEYTYGCATLSAAYVFKLDVMNYWVTLLLWVRHLKCSLCWLALSSESLSYTTLMGVQPYVQSMFVGSSYRITGLHYTYGCASLSAAYRCKLYLQNHWVTLH